MKKKFKIKRWTPGSVYAIPLSNGQFGLIQTVDLMMKNVVYIVVFEILLDEPPKKLIDLRKVPIISLYATLRSHLNNGSLAFIDVYDIVTSKRAFPNEKFAEKGYIGAKFSDIGLIAKFIEAFHGVIPWNAMYEEDYWTKYLNAGIKNPKNAWVLTPQEREKYRARL
ncbi:hypothetical protein KMW28_23995 [Flammeovirga yaeyamensis]|uniref:Transcriptional regulator n=1 Tax=Flammeovirga yaeyamensis TaxID=367791 RepID=A0AAX1NDD4_9BACT|nr:hypothetical protein [Flammeovirga yaeyamensis]MBB3696558.1 hypothetical protein [Flammeovirga yaeyamensis]NMF33236.1 hypothetical protein [Flammeovirga yaeyamensis]QWG05485.1 hypothetical protein KMW28_23995 [Flammeovirga yaeyamensis]